MLCARSSSKLEMRPIKLGKYGNCGSKNAMRSDEIPEKKYIDHVLLNFSYIATAQMSFLDHYGRAHALNVAVAVHGARTRRIVVTDVS